MNTWTAPPAWRHAVATAALLATLAALLLAIWQEVSAQRIDALREARFRFSLQNVKATLESGLRLGFAAADLPRAQGLIDPVRARQRDILSIDVFDPAGRVLFSTDQAGVGDSLPQAWWQACLQAPDGEWRGKAQDSALQCVTLVDGFERVAGGVLLRHRQSADAQEAPALPAHWPWLLAGLLALATGLAAGGWRTSRTLQARAQARLDLLQAAQLPGACGAGNSGGTTASSPAPQLALAAAALAGLEGLLERTETEVDEIDRMEAA